MKILFIAHHESLYGATKSLLDLLLGLHHTEIIPFVIAPRKGGLTKILAGRGIPFMIAPVSYWMSDQKRSLRNILRMVYAILSSAKKIKQVVREQGIDAIYTNSSVTPIGHIASWQQRIPHIWHIREFGDLDYSLKFILPRKLADKWIYNSDAIICNSMAVRKHWFDGCESRAHVVYNGVAPKRAFDDFLAHRHELRSNSEFVFSIVGSIMEKKGQELAIRAVSELRRRGLSVRLLVVGSGRQPYWDQCKELSNTLKIADRVDFKGFVEDPYEIYFASDCLLMCSENEAMGRVTAEAMSTGLPVIGKNSGGTPEIIDNEETGMLFNTYEELVDIMTQLVQNREWGRQLGLNGWKKARKCFNIEDYATQIQEIIRSVTAN